MPPATQSGDPRLTLPAPDGDARPVVALPRGGVPTWVLIAFAVIAGVLLFSVLDARRRAATAPAVRSRAADMSAMPASVPPLASTCSTHAQRAEVGLTSAAPARPRRRRSSLFSTGAMPAKGDPASGVLRLDTNGDTPSTTLIVFDISRVTRTISSMSSSVSPGRPTIW